MMSALGLPIDQVCRPGLRPSTRCRSESPTNDRTSDLLLLCLRSAWDAAALPAARALVGEVEPIALIQATLTQGVAPLLYDRLRGQGVVAPRTEASLRQAYYASTARNLRLAYELEAVLRRLASAGLRVLVLKGAALAHTVYVDPALRPMADLDLLLRPTDVDAALRALAGLGYRPLQHELARGTTRTHENEIMLGREGTTAPLELHWTLLDSPHHQHHISMDWFWQTARPLRVGGTPTQMLGPEAQLLHLCAHLVLHHGGDSTRLLWLHDVAEVLVHYQGEMDWTTVLAQARAWDLLVPLQRVLPRVAQGWHVRLPAAVLEELRQLTPSRAEDRVMTRLAAGHRPAGRRLWDDLADTPTWRRRLHLAWVNILPSAAYMRQRYRIRHPLLVPLYYPYRWFLGLRGLPRTWR